MSDIASAAAVNIVMADFANTDAQGKLNVIGGDVRVVGFDPLQGLTSRFAVAVTVTVPARFLPNNPAIEVALVSGGEVVLLPGPADQQAVRIAQTPELAVNPQLPHTIRDHVGASNSMVIDFASGLPLAPGRGYSWRVRIDGDSAHDTEYEFGVMGPPQAPVIG